MMAGHSDITCRVKWREVSRLLVSLALIQRIIRMEKAHVRAGRTPGGRPVSMGQTIGSFVNLVHKNY